MLRGLENNALDIGLVTMPAPPHVPVEPLREDEFVAIFPAHGPIPVPASATPQALAALPLVLFEPGARGGWWMTGSRGRRRPSR